MVADSFSSFRCTRLSLTVFKTFAPIFVVYVLPEVFQHDRLSLVSLVLLVLDPHGNFLLHLLELVVRGKTHGTSSVALISVSTETQNTYTPSCYPEIFEFIRLRNVYNCESNKTDRERESFIRPN